MKFEELKPQYEILFQKCQINEGKVEEVNQLVDRIVSSEERYRLVQNRTDVPWGVIAIIHSLEGGLNFKTHLHNGDPLSAKTVHVPKGRPPGNPPFTWEASAADALQLPPAPVSTWQEWTIPGVLFVLEGFNGFGYRNHQVLSPYLWSFSNHYQKGKFAADGDFDSELVSKQCGAALLLKVMLERNVDFGLDTTTPLPDPPPIPIDKDSGPILDVPAEKPMYPGRVLKIGDFDLAVVRPLQLRLVELRCGDLKGTGFFGKDTEAAVKMFQARFTDLDGRPLIIDGEVGTLTWATLFGKNTVPTKDEPGSRLLGKVLEIAVSQLNVMENPPFSNRGTQVEVFLKSVGLGGGFAWCMAFIYWCFDGAAQNLGITNPAIKTGGVLNHWNMAGQRNIPRLRIQQALDNPALIVPGMIFIIDTGDPGGSGHAGLVEKVNGGRLVTIEANSNQDGSRDGVGVFRRDARKITSINKGFIDYSSF